MQDGLGSYADSVSSWCPLCHPYISSSYRSPSPGEQACCASSPASHMPPTTSPAPPPSGVSWKCYKVFWIIQHHRHRLSSCPCHHQPTDVGVTQYHFLSFSPSASLIRSHFQILLTTKSSQCGGLALHVWTPGQGSTLSWLVLCHLDTGRVV